MIEFKNVSKTYISKKTANTLALDKVSFKLPNKGLVFILGKSGCGKSTLLNLLGGLDTVSSGNIIVYDKDITMLTNKEYDSYRNSTIGIVFQEFNLLDELTVYENIAIAHELQNKTSKEEDINKLLVDLGLKDLGNRRINELSGGQKQRVAIARALIKKPKILLADEPTGNLDSRSSKQIFDILKEISRDILVVIVSHDNDSALKYNDHIIELEDGRVTKNSIKKVEDSETKLTFIKSKLPLKYARKIGKKGLIHHPLKLFMTVLITSISLLFMGSAINIKLFDKEKLILDTMQQENEYRFTIKSYLKTYDYYQKEELTDKEKEYIYEVIGEDKINPSYFLYDPDKIHFYFEYGDQEFREKIRKEESKLLFNYYYFANPLNTTIFVELRDNRLVGNVIGKIPNKKNEILIHKYMAEYILTFGIYDATGNLYQPKTFDDIIADKHLLKIGNYEAYICGIIDDKNNFGTSNKDSVFKDVIEYDKFTTSYSDKGSYIYVKGLTEEYNSIVTENDVGKTMEFEYNYYRPHNQDWTVLNSEIKYLTKAGLNVISKLKDDEIIISTDLLKIIDQDYYKELDKYALEYQELSYKEVNEAFAIEYLKKNDISGTLYYGSYYSPEKAKVKVIGISTDHINYASSYVPKEEVIDLFASDYLIYEDDIDELKRIISKFDIYERESKNGKYLMFEPPYNYTIQGIIDIHYTIRNVILIITVIFSLFALLVFTNFISVTISYSRKKIGTLKALGASSKDILSIFAYESYITAIISSIAGFIMVLITNSILNDVLMRQFFMSVTLISNHYLTPIFILLYAVLLSLIITLISINYATRVKPIDSILEK